ncbi:MAG: hypothetical protein O2983_12715, partial [Planctomycetota bacterium]|nr:hypothetical protein [Planctomycetota bacterium]
ILINVAKQLRRKSQTSPQLSIEVTGSFLFSDGHYQTPQFGASPSLKYHSVRRPFRAIEIGEMVSTRTEGPADGLLERAVALP